MCYPICYLTKDVTTPINVYLPRYDVKQLDDIRSLCDLHFVLESPDLCPIRRTTCLCSDLPVMCFASLDVKYDTRAATSSVEIALWYNSSVTPHSLESCTYWSTSQCNSVFSLGIAPDPFDLLRGVLTNPEMSLQ